MHPSRSLLAFSAFAALAGTAPLSAQEKSVDPQRLVALLPPAWNGVKCGKPETERSTMAVAESRANMACKGTAESAHPQLEVSLTVTDLGVSGSKYYVQAARYLHEDTASESTHVVILASGRRAEYTGYTKDSMDIDTYIAPRLVAKAHCIASTEAQCKAVLEKFDFRALEAFKP